jgi:FlaA1/EpsC-like NDP-sugar epimerase
MISDPPGLIGSLVAGLILVKWVVLLALGFLFHLSTDSKLQVAIFLAQGGEFAFVLFSFATQHGVISEAVASPLIAVVALSMAATPLLMVCHEKLIQPRVGARESEDRKPDAIDEENPVIIAGFGQFGSVVGRLLRANGIQATILDLDPDNVALLRKHGIKVFYGDTSRPDMLQAAGAGQARLLILALDDQEKILEMVASVRKHFPDLQRHTRHLIAGRC